MAFLLHLLIIALGIVWVCWLIASPRACIVTSSALLAGYLGSAEGFLGTVLGLFAGAAAGGLIVGFFAVLRSAYRYLAARYNGLEDRYNRFAGESTSAGSDERGSAPPNGAGAAMFAGAGMIALAVAGGAGVALKTARHSSPTGEMVFGIALIFGLLLLLAAGIQAVAVWLRTP